MKQCKPIIINNPSKELLSLVNILKNIKLNKINELRNKTKFYFNHDYCSK